MNNNKNFLDETKEKYFNKKWFVYLILIFSLIVAASVGSNKIFTFFQNIYSHFNKEDEVIFLDETIKSEILGSKEYIFVNTKAATLSEYKAWLNGYVTNGGKVSDFGISKLSLKYRLVKKDIVVKALYGNSAYYLIVTEGVNIEFVDGDLGHTEIFYMDDFRFEGIDLPNPVNEKN